MARVVLVTGVSRYLGAHVAAALQADPRITRIIGVAGAAGSDAADAPTTSVRISPVGTAEPSADDDARTATNAHADRDAGREGRQPLTSGVPGHRGQGRPQTTPCPPWLTPPAGSRRERPDLGRTEVVPLDLRTPQIADLVSRGGVNTVVHLNLIAAPGGAGGRAAMKEINVIGTMQLLAACQHSPTVRKLIVRSTSAVYGTTARDPAVFTEEMEPRGGRGYAKDAVEIEGYVRGLARRRPDIDVSVLRFVNFMGPRVDSPMTRYFTLPVTPTMFGFDPRIQFVHPDDGVEVIRRMTIENHPGTFNVTGRGAMLISQCLRRAGRVTVPVPSSCLRLLGDAGRNLGLSDFSPDQLDLLRYGRVVDGKSLERELAWAPRYTTAGAFDEFLQARGLTSNGAVGLIDRVFGGSRDGPNESGA